MRMRTRRAGRLELELFFDFIAEEKDREFRAFMEEHSEDYYNWLEYQSMLMKCSNKREKTK